MFYRILFSCATLSMVKICCIVRGNGFREVALAATKRERDWLSNYCHPTLSNLKKLIHLTLPKNVLMKQKQFFLVLWTMTASTFSITLLSILSWGMQRLKLDLLSKFSSTCIFILITKTSQFTTCHLHLDLQLFFSSWEPYLNNVRKWL